MTADSPVRRHRYKVRGGGAGGCVGVFAEILRPTAPPTTATPVSDRVLLDVSEVVDAFYVRDQTGANLKQAGEKVKDAFKR